MPCCEQLEFQAILRTSISETSSERLSKAPSPQCKDHAVAASQVCRRSKSRYQEEIQGEHFKDQSGAGLLDQPQSSRVHGYVMLFLR